jgi:hypothetical protein
MTSFELSPDDRSLTIIGDVRKTIIPVPEGLSGDDYIAAMRHADAAGELPAILSASPHSRARLLAPFVMKGADGGDDCALAKSAWTETPLAKRIASMQRDQADMLAKVSTINARAEHMLDLVTKIFKTGEAAAAPRLTTR